MSQVTDDGDHIVGAHAIAAYLGLSYEKFVKISRHLQDGGVVFRDHWGRGKRPYLWAYKRVLEAYRMMAQREKGRG